jgi:ribosome assembly protein YihI (activator of Der GTPase)
MLDALVAISIAPVIDAQQREIDWRLGRIRRLEALMDRMSNGPRLRRAERELDRMLDHVDELNDELIRLEVF